MVPEEGAAKDRCLHPDPCATSVEPAPVLCADVVPPALAQTSMQMRSMASTTCAPGHTRRRLRRLSQSTARRRPTKRSLRASRTWSARKLPLVVGLCRVSTGSECAVPFDPPSIRSPVVAASIMPEDQDWNICGMTITPFPFHHGHYFDHVPPRPLICSAFLIDSSILYASDVR